MVVFNFVVFCWEVVEFAWEEVVFDFVVVFDWGDEFVA